MPNINAKQPDNVKGKYYVDDQCIACELCVVTAPASFKMSKDDTHAFVYKQPENEQEEKLCAEAMESCPTTSIGNDGE